MCAGIAIARYARHVAPAFGADAFWFKNHWILQVTRGWLVFHTLTRCTFDRVLPRRPLQSIGSGLVLAGAVAGLIAAPVDKQFATPHSFVGAVIALGVLVQARKERVAPARHGGRVTLSRPPPCLQAAWALACRPAKPPPRRPVTQVSVFPSTPWPQCEALLLLHAPSLSLPRSRLSQHRKAWLSLHHWMGVLLPVLACVNAFLGVLVRAAMGGEGAPFASPAFLAL